MLEIDGSYKEGGGQIIRTAMALSAITGKELDIEKIRAGRDKPGLKMQHLTGVRAVRSICRGTLEGAELGSQKLVFRPGKIVGGKYKFDVGTAGSVTLVAQTILPILLSAGKKSEVVIKGGTHVLKSPGWDYFNEVFLPALRLFGAKVDAELIKPGYYPKGGGKIRLFVEPSSLKGVKDWPREKSIRVIIRISNLPVLIAMREKKVFLNEGIENVRIIEEEALSPGNAVTAWHGLVGSYVPGEKGKRAEIVAKEAVDFVRNEKGVIDRYLADQLILYAALAEGETEFETSEITNHFKTNSGIIRKFLEREIKTEDGKVRII